MPTKSDDFYKKGDIVDAPFPYQIPQDDSEEEKYRPVLILRTLDEFAEHYFGDRPEEIDDYLTEIFQEFAEDNDTGALLVFLLVLALCSIKLSSDGADTGVTVCSGA